MDALTPFSNRLDFIRWFYFTAARPFETIERECAFRDDPYDDDPPDGLEKWKEATKGLEVLGQCCLALLAKAVQDSLREFVECEGGPGPKKAKESWFDRYCRFMEENTSLRWAHSPVSRDRIEQIILCRNDFMHDLNIDSSQAKQSPRHFGKYPVSRFNDPAETAVLLAIAEMSSEPFQHAPASLTVTRLELMNAIADASQFCGFVEKQMRAH